MSKNKKIALLGFHSRIPQGKNQLPTTKTVTCREDTDKQTDRQTDRDSEGPIDIFLVIFFLHFFIDVRSNIYISGGPKKTAHF